MPYNIDTSFFLVVVDISCHLLSMCFNEAISYKSLKKFPISSVPLKNFSFPISHGSNFFGLLYHRRQLWVERQLIAA